MQFTTSYGAVIPEFEIQCLVFVVIENLKEYGDIPDTGQSEFLEWYLNKTIENKVIQLHRDITQDELKQLEQLLAYLEL